MPREFPHTPPAHSYTTTQAFTHFPPDLWLTLSPSSGLAPFLPSSGDTRHFTTFHCADVMSFTKCHLISMTSILPNVLVSKHNLCPFCSPEEIRYRVETNTVLWFPSGTHVSRDFQFHMSPSVADAVSVWPLSPGHFPPWCERSEICRKQRPGTDGGLFDSDYGIASPLLTQARSPES